MPRRRDPVPRARAASHWLGGILLLGLLAGGVISAAVLLWENLDVRQLAPALAVDPGPLPHPAPPVSPGIQPGGFSVALFSSPRNQAFYPDETYYPAVLRRWSGLMEGLGGAVVEAGSAEDLEALDPQDVLVLPEAPCLSTAEVRAIHRHMDAGGSIVANWAVGARDEECQWRGWGTLAELTDAEDVRELANREALYVTVPGGLALSPGLDPGTRVELRPEPSLALHMAGPRVYWSDWALNPAPDESGGGADVAAVTARTGGGGRIAWFGFRLSQAATPRDSVALERLVQNGILWAAGKVQASPASWPGGKRAALLLIEDVEAEYQNAAAFADLLEEIEMPGTFFAVSQLVMEDPELGPRLARAGEVGSQTSDHNPVAGLAYRDQAVRLRRSWTEIMDWTGSEPGGLRPPEEAFDTNTLRAWSEAGGSYVLAVNQARSGSPEVHRFGDDRVVILLPRLLKDDYNVFVQEGALRSERLSEAFLEGIGKLRAIGGVAVVAVHTQIVGAGRRLDAVRDVAGAAVTQGDWWIAEAREVANWWKARDQVRLTVRESSIQEIAADSIPSGGGSLLLEVSGSEGAEGLWVNVILPDGLNGRVPSVDGEPVAYTATEWGVRVPLAESSVGGPRVITFTVPPESSDPAAGGF